MAAGVAWFLGGCGLPAPSGHQVGFGLSPTSNDDAAGLGASLSRGSASHGRTVTSLHTSLPTSTHSPCPLFDVPQAPGEFLCPLKFKGFCKLVWPSARTGASPGLWEGVWLRFGLGLLQFCD